MAIDTQKIIPLLQEYGIEYAGIFGSYARGDQREDSDVDILVRLGKRMSLPMFIRLEKEIAKTLGRKVDLVSDRGLRPRMRSRVMQDVKYFYEHK
jgi:uncharacterized protein